MSAPLYCVSCRVQRTITGLHNKNHNKYTILVINSDNTHTNDTGSPTDILKMTFGNILLSRYIKTAIIHQLNAEL